MYRSISVLIIDDDEVKAEAVDAYLREIGDQSVDVLTQVAGSLSSAAEKLGEKVFDFVVLDLMLPFITGQVAEVGAGLELLRQLRRPNGLHRTVPVIGLSAFPDEAKQSMERFSSAGVVIVQYDDSNHWKAPFEEVFLSAVSRLPVTEAVSFVIMTALESERDGYKETQVELGELRVVAGLNVQLATLDKSVGVIVRCRQMGLAAAIVDTATAIRVFKPKIVAMSGICAGRSSEVAPGQLVLASTSWEYQAGKWAKDGFQIAPYQVAIRPDTRARAEQIFNDSELLSRLEAGLDFEMHRPSVRSRPKVAPFASGSAVIASEERLKHVIAQHRKLAAIDMEVFGIYFACHESERYIDHFFAIKCVVDLADQAKDDNLHSYGAVTSARATAELLKALLH